MVFPRDLFISYELGEVPRVVANRKDWAMRSMRMSGVEKEFPSWVETPRFFSSLAFTVRNGSSHNKI
jgi:hypothetical protein